MSKINGKLLGIQHELKAPKNQRNNFGNYNYRNAEDILEAVKPLCYKWQATLTITDDIILVGDRFYVKATAKLMDIEDGSVVEVSALARESFDKKGMDSSQITGSASSYARKYALNGLFCIDDTKDADSQDNRVQSQPVYDNQPQYQEVTPQDFNNPDAHQCTNCGNPNMFYNEGVSQKTGKPYKNYKCGQCNNIEWLN